MVKLSAEDNSNMLAQRRSERRTVQLLLPSFSHSRFSRGKRELCMCELVLVKSEGVRVLIGGVWSSCMLMELM